MTTPPVLAAESLTVGYRRRGRVLRVLAEISFAIAGGEAYGLVGESGCGKTTVAMAVMRYLPTNAVVEQGRIMFREQNLLAASERELRRLRGDRIAMVYQDPGSALNPSLTVGRQVAEVFRFHANLGAQPAQDAAAHMLDLVQIPDPVRMLRRYPHELSGGQQQRIMFAMALASDPDLLVLDEPTTGLDATVEAEVLDLVEQLRTRVSAAILFISHNLGIVARLCDRVGVLYAGRLIEEGPARRLFEDPRHPYTLGLTRCVPRLGMRKRAQRLDPIAGSLPAPGTALAGCVYSPRCPIARAACLAAMPPRLDAGPERISRCLFHAEVPAIAARAAQAEQPARGPERDALLHIHDVIKRYARHGARLTALNGVSFEVRRGETLGLVGESGSGKSTLAKCVVGLEALSGGDIELAGRALPANTASRSHELRRQIQMVFQNPDTALNPSHTVRHILGRAVRLLSGTGGQALDARVRDLARAVNLSPRHLELRPASLSGGLKQRVAIARAFAGQPMLVLCDEPSSALDVSVQAVILNLLIDLQLREHVSYVFISHDLGLVGYLADRIAVMYLGEVVEIGPTDAVFAAPHHPYTEALLSAVATLDPAGGERIRLRGTIPSPFDRPSGCPFHTRCPRFLGEICRRDTPPWQHDAREHRYRCHIPPTELRDAQRQGRSLTTVLEE